MLRSECARGVVGVHGEENKRRSILSRASTELRQPVGGERPSTVGAFGGGAAGPRGAAKRSVSRPPRVVLLRQFDVLLLRWGG